MLQYVAPAPAPPSQVVVPKVLDPCVEDLPAAQDMEPSMPGVEPAPSGVTFQRIPVIHVDLVSRYGRPEPSFTTLNQHRSFI
jgi:hypothetical protein